MSLSSPSPRNIFVLGVYRNNAAFWRDCGTDLWTETEAVLRDKATFHYAFYENDSTDDTASVLSSFVQSEERRDRSFLLSERDVPGAGQSSSEFSYERCHRIATARNRLLDTLRIERPAWIETMSSSPGAVVFIYDADVLFSPSVIQGLMNTLDIHPELVLVGPYAKQTDTYRPGTPTVILPVLKRCSLSGHYYDTFSVVTEDDRMHYNLCFMHRCRICNGIKSEGRYIVNPDPETGLIPVRACFGGLVAVRAANMTAPCVRWKTTEMVYGQLSLCEHIYFCDMLRATHSCRTGSSNSRVAILSDQVVYWVQSWTTATANAHSQKK